MLQIISGKFFESDDRSISDCKGILYSNILWFEKIETCIATLEATDAYSPIPGYVMSYRNQIENEKGSNGLLLVKTGDVDILKQFKYLCTFGLKAFFNEDRNVVYKMCRTAPMGAEIVTLTTLSINRYLEGNVVTTS
jgi:hypothetical protein